MDMEDVPEEGLDIEVIAPDHASYKSWFFRKYFGL